MPKLNCHSADLNYIFQQEDDSIINTVKKQQNIQQRNLQEGEIDLENFKIYSKGNQNSKKSQNSSDIDSQTELLHFSKNQQYIDFLQQKLNESYQHNRKLQRQLIKYSIMYDDNKQLENSQATQIPIDSLWYKKKERQNFNSQLVHPIENTNELINQNAHNFTKFRIDQAKQDNIEEVIIIKQDNKYLLRIKNQNKELLKLNRTLQNKSKNLQKILTYVNNQKKTVQDQYELFVTLVQKQLGIKKTIQLRNDANQQFLITAETSCGLTPFEFISNKKQINSKNIPIYQKILNEKQKICQNKREQTIQIE